MMRFPSIFGGSWINGSNAGSRYANLDNWPENSNENISARGRCDDPFPARRRSRPRRPMSTDAARPPRPSRQGGRPARPASANTLQGPVKRGVAARAPSKPATGDLDMAEQTLRRAVANARADAYARQNLAIVLGLKGEFDEAERLARADLPANVADGNMAYLRSMLSQPALWKKMEELDREKAEEDLAPAKPATREDDKVSFLPPETIVSIE